MQFFLRSVTFFILVLTLSLSALCNKYDLTFHWMTQIIVTVEQVICLTGNKSTM